MSDEIIDRDAANQRSGRFLNYLRRAIQTLDWKEFHFFKSGGVNATNPIEVRMCFDYEMARECSKVIDFVSQLSATRREEVARKATLRVMFVAFPQDGIETFEEAAAMPPVPVACVAAAWFPQPWLMGSATERQRLLKTLSRLYATHAMPIWDFPLDSELQEPLVRTAKAEGDSLHVVAIDRSETRSALRASFSAWLATQKDISGESSRQGKSKQKAALRDLGCYRLMTRLKADERTHAMREFGFQQSVPKLSAAKKRCALRLRVLRYTN